MPEVLLEIMVLCYRMLFVFLKRRATRARRRRHVGYARFASLALAGESCRQPDGTDLAACARPVHIAAQSRNNDGPLRFLGPEFAHTRRDMAWATAGALLLIFVAGALP